jgi:leucyl aminopeptidase
MKTFSVPQIKLAKKTPYELPTVLVVNKNSDWKKAGFNESEIEYIQAKIQDKKDLITIKSISEMVFLVMEKTEDTLGYKTMEYLRKTGHTIQQQINAEGIEGVLISGEPSSATLAIAEGMALGSYQFLKYKKDADKLKNSLANIYIYSTKLSQKEIDQLNIIIESTCIARTLVNEPQSFLTATELSKQAELLAKSAGFHIDVWNKTKIKSMKMGGLLSVNQGSIEPPTFTIMEYKPAGAKNKKPIVLVGKGVVYDTGGLSLKPTPNSMDSMKCDMAGAAAVISTMHAIAKMKLKVYVVGLVPATDNRPGENAYTPGDVVEMMSGHTVEMLNADAEGRMILADALHYAKKYNPELVVDLATLTGAAAAAIGQYGIVAMGTASDLQKNALKSSGEQVYERLVEMPFWDEYADLIKSDLADMKNIGGPVAGAITAGKFLEKYTDYPWMHFDIAGPAYLNSQDSYRGKNGTGSGVRLLIHYLMNI